VLLCLGARDGDDAVLERVRRIRGVELQPELADPERLGEPRRRDERRAARRKALLRRRGDRQQVGVAPDRARTGLDALAGDDGALGIPVVDRVERAEAFRADPDRVEAVTGFTNPATECGSGH
jgi:hypothetical protein